MLRTASLLLAATSLVTQSAFAQNTVAPQYGKTPAAGCKCIAGQTCWPSASDFTRLSKNLSHPTFPVLPIAHYCRDPNYNAALCTSAQTNWPDSIWRANQPGAVQEDNWEFTDTSFCYILGNRSDTCGQGRVPVMGVNATTVADVQTALKFAVSRNLKVRVKNTGHDFLGRGFGVGSFLIWTHYFRTTDFQSNYVLSSGQKTGFPGVTVGPGVQWVDAYAFASANNVFILGGVAREGSVGAGGGWPIGGGHNILSPQYGLGADNVLEYHVILPNATAVCANQYTNTDLFWALRGGGGPTFGIVTSVTYKGHPLTPLYFVAFEATAATNASFITMMDTWLQAMPALDDGGWSGYYPWSNASYLALMYMLPNGNTSIGNATIGKWINQVATVPGINVTTNRSVVYPNYQTWMLEDILHPETAVGYNYSAAGPMGVGVTVSNWIMPRTLFESNTTSHQMAVAISNIVAGGGQHVAGGAMAKFPVDSNAINPAWRTSLGNMGSYGGWADGTSPADILAVRQAASDALAPLRNLAPATAPHGSNGGQYLNEADYLVPNYTVSNWGAHYPRLLSIKKAIDPNNVFLVTQGVGAENWDSPDQICPLSSSTG